jgi:molybdenum cofactor biosynthesis enzyme MoaA
LCVCDAWLPIVAGNISDFSCLEQIWDNPAAHDIQQDIVDKKYTYCAVEHCGILYKDQVYPRYRINVAIDDSCNLACPTCRRGMINHTKGSEFERKLSQVNHFVKLLNEFDQPTTVILTGTGDPLASLIMRPLLLDWIPKNNHQVIMFTNGLLIEKLLPGSRILPHISEFQISIDAGTAEIYEQVRAPGRFSVLLQNLNWLKNNRGNALVRLKFVVSAINSLDIVNFANLCYHYNFIGEITKLDDWGTFDNFADQNVIDNPGHPKYTETLSQLRTVSTMKHIELSPIFKKLL